MPRTGEPASTCRSGNTGNWPIRNASKSRGLKASLRSKKCITAAIAVTFACVMWASFRRQELGAISIYVAGFASGLLVLEVFVYIRQCTKVCRPVSRSAAFMLFVQVLEAVYLLYLVFLLSLTPSQARHSMTYFDKNLNKPLPERDYASNCDILKFSHPSEFLRTLKENVDLFVFAHVLGWFFKSFLYRDVFFCWLWSIVFELCEYALAHILPNFNECWWDHLILDILTCNAIGIYLGHLVIYLCKTELFNWAGMKEHDNRSVFFKALWPYSVSPLHIYFASPSAFFQCVLLLIISAVVELNCFFLKATLWIPPEHYLVTARLGVMLLISYPASRAYYRWCSGHGGAGDMYLSLWTYFAILVAEVLVSLKFSREILETAGQTPTPVKVSVVLLSLALLGSLFYCQVWSRRNNRGGRTRVATVSK
ncbi:phosphatidylserine synthase 2-like [Schistocerca gregaria]|uniref:phosphatidylserine synthase 2-like n=1 Tax=Schistocerca gregaria TaxID=7010 RepID=UPI00211E624A|nr:phosphatidylserine synthase 2-like [Schistocerca gregaria]